MVTTHPITEEAYTKLVFANPDRKLELYEGEVREKRRNLVRLDW